MKRRDFLKTLSLLGLSPGLHSCLSSIPQTLYPVPAFGNVTLLHMTDCHAQLLPVYYREPSLPPGIDNSHSRSQYLAGKEFLDFFGIKRGSREAYAFSHFDFSELATIYGKMGGFAYLATLVKQLNQASSHGNLLLLDGGDTWQGSATALWTQGVDMLAVCNLLGVDVMTGHWEFTYGSAQLLENIKQFNGDFVAQNILLTEESQFASGVDSNSVFKPYVIKTLGNSRLAIIGQAYPYTPIANPKRLIPDWQFGIQEQRLQQIVNDIKQKKSADVIILLSHNGLGIDLKLASRVVGIDIILGGHTHDTIPKPIWINNSSGRTCVTNAGSHGKFLAAIDLEIHNNQLRDLRYRLLPVFSNLLESDVAMQDLISSIRKPYIDKLQQSIAVTDSLLYRRDTYQGTFDKLLLDALLEVNDAEISLSPGFRWGTSLLPGQTITYEDVMNQTAITYPNTLRRYMTGSDIKAILEDAADNLFNKDPYYQQGGDMVRAGGITYRCDTNADFGHRISQIRLSNGELLEANKIYSVASWASVNYLANGKPMAEVLVDFFKQNT